MRRTPIIAAVAFLLASAFAVKASATSLHWTSPLGLNDPGIVGIAKGLSGDNPGSDAILIAQQILDLGADFNDYVNPDSTGHNRLYRTSSTDYGGTLTSGGKTNCGSCEIAAGWEYVIAKYDGPNGGWVLFYLGGNAAALPQYSYGFWGGPTQYGISDVTVFNAVSVPDGGSTAALLGSALFAVAALRRRFNRQ